MYSGVYLFLKVVEKNIFLNKKVMECIFKYTRLYTNYILDSVKKWPPCCGGQTLWISLKPMALGNPLHTIATSPRVFE